jgi:hypothetical protein
MLINIYICNKVANIYVAQKRIIRQFLAGVLLLVFAFSITPKKFLHDAFANHKDKPALTSLENKPQFSLSGFMCKCDNLVAESPFTDAAAYFDFVPVQLFSVHKDATLYHFYSSTFFFFELRGPPADNKKIV